MEKRKKLVIVGDSALAEIAYEYYQYDSPYDVTAFAVEAAYRKRDELFGLPIVNFEELAEKYAPAECDVYVAVSYAQLNRLRTRLARDAKNKGFALASYISSKAFVWRNVKLGEHCFIFEDNTIQPFVEIEDNVVLWSGNHIGHHSHIGKNCFISSHVVVSGYCEIGDNVFLGVNATVANNLKLGDDCWIGPGVTLTKDVESNTLFKGPQAEPAKVASKRFFRVAE